MKRILLLLLLGVGGALGLWFGLRGGSSETSSAAVTSLLPKETLAFVHLPDLNRTRAEWRETDIYKLWREPAVQDFLQKPLSRVPERARASQRLAELEALGVKDGFLAITSWEDNQLGMLGGFRFKGKKVDAEKVIGQWRERAQQAAPAAKRETVAYERHQIEVTSRAAVTIATVYAGDWFLAANDVASLKALLDRVDRRTNDPALRADETFAAAAKRMPARYNALGYARLDTYFQKLSERFPQEGAPEEHMALLRKVRSVSAATTIADGKMRDVLFVAMPKAMETGELTRSSLALGTSDSFLYAASFLALPKGVPMPDAAAATQAGMPAILQRLLSTMPETEAMRAEWHNAFGSEVGVIADWPADARVPALLATIPVKDAAKARQLIAALAAAGEGNVWTASEKEGVQYHSRPPLNPMVPVAPTIALSDKLLVAGLDPGTVEAAIKRGAASGSGVAASQTFQDAERLVPAPKHAFSYIDSALLYQRLDAALRPMLVMAAAFVPGIAEAVDLGKLPSPEVITKHLSPFVMSQRYEGDGYMTEAVGPVSIYQAAMGAAVVTGFGTAFYQRTLPAGTGVLPAPVFPPPSPDPSPTPEDGP